MFAMHRLCSLLLNGGAHGWVLFSMSERATLSPYYAADDDGDSLPLSSFANALLFALAFFFFFCFCVWLLASTYFQCPSLHTIINILHMAIIITLIHPGSHVKIDIQLSTPLAAPLLASCTAIKKKKQTTKRVVITLD